MKNIWKDWTSGFLIVTSGVVVYAKLESYSWWLMGSWKGALGILGILGLSILLINVADFVNNTGISVVNELVLWATAAIVVVTSLFSATTSTEFVGSAVLISLAWAAQFARHLWFATHHDDAHLAANH